MWIPKQLHTEGRKKKCKIPWAEIFPVCSKASAGEMELAVGRI